MNPPISTIYKNDDIDIDNYTQAIQDNEIDKENEGKTFEEVLTLLYSVHVKYVNELKTKYDHKLDYQKRITEYNVQQLELDNKKLKLKIEQLERQIKFNEEEEPRKYNMQKNHEMKIVFEKELKHWQQQYHTLKKHFKNYQIKAKERIEQWKKYSEYIKYENQKLQNEIIAKLPDITRNNIDVSMLMDITNDKEKNMDTINKKVKIEDYDSSKLSQPSKKRKYSESTMNDQDILSSPVIKTPSSRIIENLNIQSFQKKQWMNGVKNERNDNLDLSIYSTTTPKKNEFTTPKKKITQFNNRNINLFRQGTVYNPTEVHPSSCTTIYDEGDNNIRILSSPTPTQENPNKPSFMLSSELTSTPNPPKLDNDFKLSKKLSNLSIKENVNQNVSKKDSSEVVEYVATTPVDEIKTKNKTIKSDSNNITDDKTSKKKENEEETNHNNNNNNSSRHIKNSISSSPTSSPSQKGKPLQRQNSMILTREQLKQMSKPQQKEKISFVKSPKPSSADTKTSDNIETIDEDLKNIMIESYHKTNDDVEMIIDTPNRKDQQHEKEKKALAITTEETVNKNRNKGKGKKKKKKKKNILLSPSDRILKELCESSDVELHQPSDFEEADTDDDDDDGDDDNENDSNEEEGDHSENSDEGSFNEAYSIPLNSSQKSEEIIKNLNAIKVGQALVHPNPEPSLQPQPSSSKIEGLVKGKMVEEEFQRNEKSNEIKSKTRRMEENRHAKKIKKTPQQTQKTETENNKKKKGKKRSRRRETIIPQTPSAIRSDSSESEEEDGGEPGDREGSDPEKKVYIWKTNYQANSTATGAKTTNPDEIDNLQNPSFMFEVNDEEEEEDLDLEREIENHSNNNNRKEENREYAYLAPSEIEGKEQRNILEEKDKEKKEIEKEKTKEKEEIIINDPDITMNDKDLDIIEVIKRSNSTLDPNNNSIKIKKTKQQTLYNYTNLKSDTPLSSSPIHSVNEVTIIPVVEPQPSTPSKNLKLRRKKKSEVLYNETVRQKHKRRQLHGTTCPCCSDFFSAVNRNNDGTRVQEISRHRYNNIPKDTPEEYWDVNFPSSKPDYPSQ